MASRHTFYADNLVDALLEEGIPAVQIWELDGWKLNEQGYYWTDIHTDQHHGYDGVSNGHFNHHTASQGYTPYVKNSSGQTKATAWAGMRVGGRLYQNANAGVPTIALASSGPADYSAGSGVRDYIKKLDASQEALRQVNSDDSPKFYGNRYVLNTEIVCDGIGGAIDADMWDLLIVYNAALSRLHDAGHAFNGFHQGFTKRKIDYRDGRFANASDTISAMWLEIAQLAMESDDMMDLERYATRWRNPQDFDAAAIKGLITEAEAAYWKTVPTDSEEWADLRDAIEVRFKLW